MKQNIDISTNHNNSLLTINLPKEPGPNSKVSIYNRSGILIKQVKISRQVTSIGIDSLKPGFYLMIYISGREVKAVRFEKR